MFILYRDDGQSPEHNWLSVLYTVVRTFWNLIQMYFIDLLIKLLRLSGAGIAYWI
jgi:hypothetical protein